LFVVGKEVTKLPYEFSCHTGGKLHQKNDVKGDYFCISKRKKNCPFFPRRYWCGVNYTQNILSKMKLEYPNVDFSSRSYAKKWTMVLKERGDILFVGDSVHSHPAFSLMCLLREHIKSEKIAFSTIFSYTARISLLHRIPTRKNFCVRSVSKSLICYDRTNVAQNILDNYRRYKKLFSEFGIIVLNFGLHDKDFNLIPVQLLFRKLKRDLNSKTALVWRETAPQHFNNEGGVYSPEKLNDNCVDISTHSQKESNRFNHKYNSIFQENEIPILKIWNLTKRYFDAHVQGECTHYCQPGIAELWLHELYTLLNQLRGYP